MRKAALLFVIGIVVLAGCATQSSFKTALREGEAGQYRQAELKLDELVVKDSTQWQPHFYRGLARFEQGKYKDAIADFTAAIACDTLDKKHLSRCYRGLSYSMIDDYNRADSDLAEAFEESPLELWYLLNRTINFDRAGRFDEALEGYQSLYDHLSKYWKPIIDSDTAGEKGAYYDSLLTVIATRIKTLGQNSSVDKSQGRPNFSGMHASFLWQDPNRLLYRYVEQPIQIWEEEPEYPDRAENEGVQGDVYIEAFVDEKGLVTKAEVTKTNGETGWGFEDAALKAAYKNRFRPALFDDIPTGVWVAYRVKFTIP